MHLAKKSKFPWRFMLYFHGFFLTFLRTTSKNTTANSSKGEICTLHSSSCFFSSLRNFRNYLPLGSSGKLGRWLPQKSRVFEKVKSESSIAKVKVVSGQCTYITLVRFLFPTWIGRKRTECRGGWPSFNHAVSGFSSLGQNSGPKEFKLNIKDSERTRTFTHIRVFENN